MPEIKNGFIGGINQDNSPDKYNKNQFFSGTNIKILTEKGLSSGAIENEDGNAVSFKIPDTHPIYKIKYNDPGSPTNGLLSITFTNLVGNTFTFNTALCANIEDLYKSIIDILSTVVDITLKVILKNDEIFIITYSDTAITSISGTGGLSNTAGDNPFVTSQTGLKIIGWGSVRDYLILFTTNETSSAPANSSSQIWRLQYDLKTHEVLNLDSSGYLTVKDHMIYNNYLNFSSYYPIGTETVGNYENSSMAKIYWTDDYNLLRNANILDAELLATSPSQLAITSGFKPSLATLTGISGGSLEGAKTYQYCYRLSSEGGQKTIFSPLTNPTPLASVPIGNSSVVGSRYYEVSGDNLTGQSLTYTVEDIDTSFELIEHILVVRGIGSEDIPTIVKVKEEFVPADGNLEVIISDYGDNVTITEEEFNFIQDYFKRAKTITSKDKRLVAANLSLVDKAIDDYDARAFRYNTSKQSSLEDKERSTIVIGLNTGLDESDVPEDFDCINVFNADESYQDDSTDEYKFKKDGATLGGEGANISYEFIVEEIVGKTAVFEGNGSGIYTIASVNNYDQWWYDNRPFNGKNIKVPGSFQSFKNPIVSTYYKGYARGEVYRFGIVFYDLFGNPYSTKWIGDIKIPTNDERAIWDETTQALTTPSLGRVDGNTRVWAKNIGIRFNVDISSLQGSISGYEIVRMDRPLQERTKLAQGVLQKFDTQNSISRRFAGATSAGNQFDMQVNGTLKNYVLTLNDRPSLINSSFNSGTTMYGFTSAASSVMVNKDDFFEINYKLNDRVRTVEYHNSSMHNGSSIGLNAQITAAYTGRRALSQITNTVLEPSIIVNKNTAGSSTSNIIQVRSGRQVFIGGEYNPGEFTGNPNNALVNGNPGMFQYPGGPRDKAATSSGCPKGILDLYGNFEYINASEQYNSTNNYWRIVAYERTLLNQYGGNTYEARGSNKYISAGAFYRVSETTSNSTTLDVFGGDVFTQYTPIYYSMNNYGSTNQCIHVGGIGFLGESTVNVEMMQSQAWSMEYYREWITNAVYPLYSSDPLSGRPPTPGDYAFISAYDVYSFDNTTKQIYRSPDFYRKYPTEFPHRIWASEKKLDGEFYDSWKVFLSNNYSEVDGMYGPINKISTIRDTFYYYQDIAFGAASINDRSVITDEDGIKLNLGSGGILDDYKYISRNTGTTQKWSVIPAGNSIHHYDTVLKKWVRFSDGPIPVSDLKGIYSTLQTFDGNILKTADFNTQGIGIHGVYDKVRNRVYMTFLDAEADYRKEYTIQSIRSTTGSSIFKVTATDIGKYMRVGDLLGLEGNIFLLIPGWTAPFPFTGETYTITSVDSDDSVSIEFGTVASLSGTGTPEGALAIQSKVNHTLIYNENLQTFETFQDSNPHLWIESYGKLLSVNPALTSGWQHYKGNKNSYFGIVYPSTIELIINPAADLTCVFDNLVYKGEIFINDIDQSNLTFDTLRVLNDHQDSGIITLTPDGNVERKLRSWRTNIPRDIKSTNSDARMRDYYIKLILEHTPDNNERLILHDVTTVFRPSPH